MKISITGTVKAVKPYVSGDPDDPIRIIDIDLGKHVSWHLINLDLENEEMEIEVTPSETVIYDTGEVDGEDEPIMDTRPSTSEEKAEFIEYARKHSLERVSKEDLYALSGSPRLVNPFRVES